MNIKVGEHGEVIVTNEDGDVVETTAAAPEDKPAEQAGELTVEKVQELLIRMGKTVERDKEGYYTLEGPVKRFLVIVNGVPRFYSDSPLGGRVVALMLAGVPVAPTVVLDLYNLNVHIIPPQKS